MKTDTSLTLEFDMTDTAVIVISIGEISLKFPQDKELRMLVNKFLNQIRLSGQQVIKMELLEVTTILAHLQLFNINFLRNNLLEEVCERLETQILKKSTAEATLAAINEQELKNLLKDVGIQ